MDGDRPQYVPDRYFSLCFVCTTLSVAICVAEDVFIASQEHLKTVVELHQVIFHVKMISLKNRRCKIIKKERKNIYVAQN